MIARSLVAALRDAGHRADLVVTPQNRFGRQAAAYLATWLTDVGRTHDDQSIDPRSRSDCTVIGTFRVSVPGVNPAWTAYVVPGGLPLSG